MAGVSAPWAFPGALRFSNWAQSRPWRMHGGLSVVRVSDLTYWPSLLQAVSACARGCNADLGYLDVKTIECGGPYGLPLNAVLNALEIDPTLGPFEARDPLRFALQDRSVLFVLVEAEPVPPHEWELFVALVEHYGKLAPSIPLSVVVVDSRWAVSVEPSFDFTQGLCQSRLLDLSSELEKGLVWQTYLHLRSAWESGGTPRYAALLGEQLVDVPIGEETKVEGVLSRIASERAAAQFDLKMLNEMLAQTSHSATTLVVRRDSYRKLDELKATWRPPGSERREILPWLSRAVLANGQLTKGPEWALRHNLVCMPLAGEIIAHCLKAEAQIRTQLHGRPQREHLPDHAVDGINRLRTATDKFVIYPDGYPLPPIRDDDVWAFAPLGDTMKACAPWSPPALFWDTLKLRNALMHGHYVGWRHVEHALQQMKRLT